MNNKKRRKKKKKKFCSFKLPHSVESKIKVSPRQGVKGIESEFASRLFKWRCPLLSSKF
jgi:hypothetical protein